MWIPNNRKNVLPKSRNIGTSIIVCSYSDNAQSCLNALWHFCNIWFVFMPLVLFHIYSKCSTVFLKLWVSFRVFTQLLWQLRLQFQIDFLLLHIDNQMFYILLIRHEIGVDIDNTAGDDNQHKREHQISSDDGKKDEIHFLVMFGGNIPKTSNQTSLCNPIVSSKIHIKWSISQLWILNQSLPPKSVKVWNASTSFSEML